MIVVLHKFQCRSPAEMAATQVHKVPFIGDSNGGKTSLITRFTTNRFVSTPATTVGVAHVQIRLRGATQEFVANIWDTAGQERFRSLVPLYARGADVLVLVFALDAPDALAGLDGWHEKVRGELQLTCPIILVGNKSDLRWAPDAQAVRDWARARGCRVVFTSARTGSNVQELFGMIATQLEHGRSAPEAPERVRLAPTARAPECC
jgi:small GTP-binding protein